MKERILYQTLEDRSNNVFVEKNGPGYCNDEKAWLCPGYYFWEASIEVARWWGVKTYTKNRKGYIVCKSSYDYAGDNFFDLVGDTDHKSDFWEAVDVVEKEYEGESITVAMVLGFMREDPEFSEKFKAVRAYPIKSRNTDHLLYFAEGNGAYIEKHPPIQICIWHDCNFILKSKFLVVETNPFGYKYKF